MSEQELTERQREILDLVRDRISQRGSSPTHREIAAHFNFSSPNAAKSHLDALIRRGLLSKNKSLARGLELSTSAGRPRRVPLVGQVPAGLPIDAIENTDAELSIDEQLLPRANCFALKVVGESMIDAGILDGDTVIVQKQDVARNHEIVVAIVEGEATVKRYVKEGGKITLLPENAAFDPIVVPANADIRIAGKVVGLIRRMG